MWSQEIRGEADLEVKGMMGRSQASHRGKKTPRAESSWFTASPSSSPHPQQVGLRCCWPGGPGTQHSCSAVPSQQGRQGMLSPEPGRSPRSLQAKKPVSQDDLARLQVRSLVRQVYMNPVGGPRAFSSWLQMWTWVGGLKTISSPLSSPWVISSFGARYALTFTEGLLCHLELSSLGVSF